MASSKKSHTHTGKLQLNCWCYLKQTHIRLHYNNLWENNMLLYILELDPAPGPKMSSGGN